MVTEHENRTRKQWKKFKNRVYFDAETKFGIALEKYEIVIWTADKFRTEYVIERGRIRFFKILNVHKATQTNLERNEKAN